MVAAVAKAQGSFPSDLLAYMPLFTQWATYLQVRNHAHTKNKRFD